MKEKFDLLAGRLQDVEVGIRTAALNQIRTEVASATSSMTSVPKPLKFLRPHYDAFKEYYEKQPASDFKVRFGEARSLCRNNSPTFSPSSP